MGCDQEHRVKDLPLDVHCVDAVCDFLQCYDIKELKVRSEWTFGELEEKRNTFPIS